MDTKPKVGIVIPSYERLEYLKECVKSALDQTYPKLEIIIIDDCSPSPSIRQYLETIESPKVKWVINNRNLGTTRNYDSGVGLLGKDVEWCLLLDNDDFLDSDFIKEAVEMHLSYPQGKIIHGRQIFLSADRNVIGQDLEFPAMENAEDYLSLRCIGMREIRSSSLFFNIARFKKIGGYPLFDTGMGTDAVFVFSMAFDNCLLFSQKAVIYTRIHDKAESSTTDDLPAKLISTKQMRDYCRQVYRDNSGYRSRRKRRVLAYLEYNARDLVSTLLSRKYGELLNGGPRRAADNAVKELMEFCHMNGITLPGRFLLLINLSSFLKADYKKFNFMARRMHELVSLEKYILLKRYNFASLIKRCLKKFPVMNVINKQISIIFSPSLRKTHFITGFRRCCSCGMSSLFYWDKGYENYLREAMPKWGVEKSYTERMIRRENDFCANCGSSFRVRAHTRTILKMFNQADIKGFISFLARNPSFVVYETANYALFRSERLKKIDNYIVSEYRPSRPFGKKIGGVRNENLERLTFDNESVDLLITSDVLEHVSDLSMSLAEIYRVLKRGGYHIFTVPADYSMPKTRTRALGADGAITHLLSAAMHGDDITDGVVAFRDFGADIDAIIKRHGFSFEEDRYYSGDEHVTSVYINRKL